MKKRRMKKMKRMELKMMTKKLTMTTKRRKKRRRNQISSHTFVALSCVVDSQTSSVPLVPFDLSFV